MKSILLTGTLLLCSIGMFAQNEEKDSIAETKTELNEVVVEKKKKAVERKADRTIFDFSEQAHLNSGSLLEGLKKLPGLIVSDMVGMLYQGKQLQVYMDGRPLNIYSNELVSYLEGLPANSIEKVEIITNPGAEFPATSGGAIINIVTSKKVNKYLSATYSNGFGYTNYDKSRYRFNNSMTVSAANKLFSWQLQGGQNYSENFRETKFNNRDVVLSDNYSDRVNGYYYLNSGLKFDLKKDRLLINYNLSTSNNAAYIEAAGEGFAADDKGKTKSYYHDVALTYQKRFDDPMKKLDFQFSFNDNKNKFDQQSRLTGINALNNKTNQDFYQFKTDYNQQVNFLDKSKLSMGVLVDRLDFEAINFGLKNLDYTRTTGAAYAEGQTTYKKFEFIAGLRLETYNIEGNTDTADLIPFKKTRLFPNGTIQYNLIDHVYAKVNYNNKIQLPNTSSLNPNNTNYQNPNVGFFGNPNLDPTIYNNYEVTLSAFEYFTIGYGITDTKNQVINRMILTDDGAFASITENLPEGTVRNFNIGMPIPFMLFTKGLKQTLQMDFNPDEINFLYLYAGNQKYLIPGVDTKSIWEYNVSAQILLPAKVKLNANFNTSNTGGNYYYYTVKKPLYQQLNLTFSRKFLSNNLSASLYVNDVFNMNKQGFGMYGTPLSYTEKYDSRRFGLSFNYKIPTKNKPERETNLINGSSQPGDQNKIGN
jgi:Outer membrane protein beta-barrel family